METILIPEYKSLKSGVSLCVDRFCGYVTSLNYTLRLQTAEYRVEPKVNWILKRIIKDNDIQNNGLMRLLGSCTMEFLKQTTEHETNKRELNTKQMKVKFEETLNRSDKNELKVNIDQLEKIKKFHINTMKTSTGLLGADWRPCFKEILWKLNVNNNNLKRVDKVKMDYLKTIEVEEKIRLKMKQITENIKTGLKAKISERIVKSIDTLRWLAAEFTAYERTEEMLSYVNGLDVNVITEGIIESFCHRYRYAVPSDYFHFMDFDSYLLKEPQNSEPEKLTLCLDLLEDEAMSDCLCLQSYLVNKKSGLGRFFNFQSKSGTKQVTKTRNELYSEALKEKMNQKSVICTYV